MGQYCDGIEHPLLIPEPVLKVIFIFSTINLSKYPQVCSPFVRQFLVLLQDNDDKVLSPSTTSA